MKKSKLSGGEQEGESKSEGREGEGGVYKSTSFSSMPSGPFESLSDTARKRDMFPRDLFSEAVLFFVSERRKRKDIPYVVPRRGGIKKTIWLSEEACKLIDEVSKNDKVSKNVLFLTALQLYANKEGLDVGF